jgi:hypothetical protein
MPAVERQKTACSLVQKARAKASPNPIGLSFSLIGQESRRRRPEPPGHDGQVEAEEMGMPEDARHHRQRDRSRQRRHAREEQAQK